MSPRPPQHPEEPDLPGAKEPKILKPLSSGVWGFIVNPRKLEHGFRTISAGIFYTLP